MINNKKKFNKMNKSEQKKIEVVFDANVFIRHPDFNKIIQEYSVVTSKLVIPEIRDLNAKNRLRAAAGEIKVTVPSKSSLNFVTSFAKKTGDFVSLSAADFHVIALGVDLIKQAGKFKELNKEPKQAINHYNKQKDKEDKKEDKIEEESKNDKNEDNKEYKVEEDKKQDKNEDKNEDKVEQESKNDNNNNEIEHLDEKVEKKNYEDDENEEQEMTQKKSSNDDLEMPVDEEDEDSEDMDDEEGWVTKENLQKTLEDQLHSKKLEESDNRFGVFIMTTDFAMQNIIMQMGIPLLSFEGMRITKIKNYVLECFACWNITRDTTKQFCPKCGNGETLLKVTCSFNEDGSMVLYRKKNYRIKKRGWKYAIPNPKGGRRNEDLILCEDQLMMPNVKSKIRKQQQFREKELKNAEVNYGLGWGFDELKKSNRHFRDYEVGYGRKNPNDRDFWKGKKKRGKKRK